MMLHLETQVLRKGDYLVSYYAARGFRPAQHLLLLAYPLVALKLMNNVVFSAKPNLQKEMQDAIVTLVGAFLSNRFTMSEHKSLHFVGVGFWLYGLQFLALVRERKERNDGQKCKKYTLTHAERVIIGYQSVSTVTFGLSYFLRSKPVTQLAQFAIILTYGLWYGKDLLPVDNHV